MLRRRRKESIALEAFGVPLEVALNVKSKARHAEVLATLPPGWRRYDDADTRARFEIVEDDDGTLDVRHDDSVIVEGAQPAVAIGVLDARMRAIISREARDRVFVHAGVVAVRDRAIVIPGRSFSGKTTLVSALLRAGATYYSDEYAVLEEGGLVHPYPRPLSIRTPGVPNGALETAADELGASTGADAVPLALVVFTQYRADAVWEPMEMTPAEIALRLLENTIAARDEPERVLRSLSAAVEHADGVEGNRGEAESVAATLLGHIR